MQITQTAPTKISEKQITQLLESKGIRSTLHRIKITQFIFETEHPTADQIWNWAQHTLPKVSRATVYNTLSELVSAGLIQELKFPHTNKVIYDHNTHHHFHFLNEDTGELYDIEPHHLNVSASLGQEFQIDGMEILLKGKVVTK